MLSIYQFVRVSCLLLALTLMGITALADVPHTIKYQGRLVDDTGQPVADGSYDMTFAIWDVWPVPMGTSPLWESGPHSVPVNDGMFSYLLGESVPLPVEVFSAVGGGERILSIAVTIDGQPLALKIPVDLNSVPFSYQAAHADTAEYAKAGPGSGATGWTDDGSVVRLETFNDRVGIGTNSPSERLVVGKDIGGFGARFVVSGSYYLDDQCGYKMGYSSDHHSTVLWDGDGAPFSIGTTEFGTNYYNTLIARSGKIGIGGATNPSEPLVVGDDLGSFNGDRIVVGDNTAGAQTGLVLGEDNDNRAWMLWDIDDNYLAMGMKSLGTSSNNRIVMREDHIGIGTTTPDEHLHVNGNVKIDDKLIVSGTIAGNDDVQLPTNSISSWEIFNESGIANIRTYSENGIPQSVWDTLLIRAVNLPTSGYVVVIASCEFAYEKTTCYTEFGIVDNTGVAPHAYLYTLPGDPQGGFVALQSRPVTIHETFSVSAGTNVFALVAKDGDTPDAYPPRIFEGNLTILFFPTGYGTSLKAGEAEDGFVTVEPAPYTELQPTPSIESRLAELEEEIARLKEAQQP